MPNQQAIILITRKARAVSTNLLRKAYVVAAGLFVAGCENAPTRSDPTAPDLSDGPSSAMSTRAEISHFRSRGPLAQVTFSAEQPSGVISGYLEVTRGGSTTDQQTFLFYDIERCDPVTFECVTIEQGSGLIPNRDLRVRGQTMTLHTHTSAASNPDYYQIGSGGAINLTWTTTSAFLTTNHVQSRTRVKGVFLEHDQFASTVSSALTQGLLIGVAITPGNSAGLLGSARSGTIVIEKAVP